ncbi:putative lipoprotein [Acinetobacter sp. 826659]|nr:putative lipoprotein [Acinetobacter sp. 826659]
MIINLIIITICAMIVAVCNSKQEGLRGFFTNFFYLII